MDIKEFRTKYPEYDDADDTTLSKALHKKYYPHVTYEAFSAKFGNVAELPPPPDVVQADSSDLLAKKESGPGVGDSITKGASAVGQSFKNIGSGAAAAFNRGVGGFAANLDKLSTFVSEKTGLPKGGVFDAASKVYSENSEYWDKKIKNGNITEEIMADFLGGAAPGMAEFMLSVPYAAALGGVDGGVKGAIKEGTSRALMGKILHAANTLRTPSRTAAMAVVGGVEAAAHGGDAREIAKGAGVMAGFGLTAGRGQKTAREAGRDFKESFGKPVMKDLPPQKETPLNTPGFEEGPEYADGKESKEVKGENVVTVADLEKAVKAYENPKETKLDTPGFEKEGKAKSDRVVTAEDIKQAGEKFEIEAAGAKEKLTADLKQNVVTADDILRVSGESPKNNIVTKADLEKAIEPPKTPLRLSEKRTIETPSELATTGQGVIPEVRAQEPAQLEGKVAEPQQAEPAKKKKRPKGAGVSTLRGRIKQAGGVNFLNFKGELKEMSTSVKFLSKKTGTPIDLLEETLRTEGWLDKNENLLDVLRNQEVLKRGKIVESSGDGAAKTEYQQEQDRKFKEQTEYEPESPPEGKYKVMDAQDLPEGKTLTIIDGNGIDGWDTYKVIEKDPFGVTLQDGRIIELSPFDKVEVMVEGKAPKGGKSERGGTSAAADTDSYADIKTVMEMPEIVKLAKGLMGGRYPKVAKMLRGENWRGVFYTKGEGDIQLKADIFKDPATAAKVLSHEIGHLVDWLPEKDLSRGNILGRIATLKKYMKQTAPGKPGGPGPLSAVEKSALMAEAEKIKKFGEKWVDEEIVKTMSVTPEDVLGIWNNVAGDIRKTNKEMYEYIQKASAAEKKSIVKSALKGQVAADIQRFSKTITEKTGKKVKVGIEQKATRKQIDEKYRKLVKAEIKKRALLERDVIMDELKAFTLKWKPFDPKENKKHTKYRFSSKELYADAFSAIITNPGYLKTAAPNFYKGFFNYIERKPELRKIYNQIQNEIKSGDIARNRVTGLRDGFQRGEDAWAKQIKDSWETIKSKDEWGTTFIDRYFSILRRAKEVGEDTIPDHLSPRYAIEEMTYSAAESEAYLTDLKAKVLDPSKEAGLSYVDIGEYLFHKRVSTERSEIANPEGWTKDISAKRLAEMDKTFGPELKKSVSEFIKIREEFFISKAKEADMYGPELIKKIADNPNYATFDIVEHMVERYGPEATGRIMPQIGTLKTTANPFSATIVKDLQLMRAISKNNASRIVTNFLKKHFGSELVPADTRWNGRTKAVIDTRDPNKGLLVYMDNGEVVGSYVSKYIAEAFQKNPIEGQLIAKILSTTARPFKTVFTELSTGFMMFNIIRDYKRAATNIHGLTLTKFLPYYLKSIKKAMKSTFGKPDPTVKELLKLDALISVADQRGDYAEDVQLDRMLKRFSVSPTVWRNKVLRPFGVLFDTVANISKGVERIPKVAAYSYLKKNFPEMSGKRIAHIIRVHAGSPAFLRQGTGAPIYNNLLFFSSAQKEGWRGDAEAMMENPAEYAWKSVKYNIIPKLLMRGLALGFAGAGVKAMMDRISEYDKTNYTTIPLGITPSGKTVYIRVPHDEMGRFVGGSFWKMYGLSEDSDKKWTELFDYMAGQAPTLHPIFGVISGVVDYVGGRNPQNYMGNDAVRDQVFKAGGMRSHKEFAKWMSNSMGGGIIHRFRGGSPNEIKTELEKIIGLPFLSDTLGRFVKVSDYGVRESIRGDKDKLRKISAENTLATTEALTKLLGGGKLSKAEQLKLIENAGSLDSKIITAVAGAQGTVYIQEFLSARSNAEKLAVLARWKKDPLYNKPKTTKNGKE